MRTICASCGALLRGEGEEAGSTELVSHGLCPDCARHFLAVMGIPLDDYLEGLGEPVIMLSRDGRIGALNSAAAALLGRPPEVVRGLFCGDVFECEHALLEEGCGRTVHCSGCTIRRLVRDTWRTGRTHAGVGATLRHQDPEVGRIAMRIGTELRGGVVFLTLEDLRVESVDDGSNRDRKEGLT